MEEEKKISIPLIIGGLVLVIIIGAGGVFFSINQQNTPTNNTPTSTPPVATPPVTPPTQTGSSYKNGTYTSEGSYVSPGGTESIKVELTLTDDVVSAVTVTPEATRSDSVRYQGKFASGIAAVVVGKKLNALNVTKVNGSSLTGTGFNKAVAEIKTQAQI